MGPLAGLKTWAAGRGREPNSFRVKFTTIYLCRIKYTRYMAASKWCKLTFLGINLNSQWQKNLPKLDT